MADTPLHYEKMVENAMRGVARDALQEAASHGLPGEHHFYIGFKTGAPEVEMPDHLRAQYPEDITIILQHQYWDLLVDEAGFAVGLAFGGKREQLYVPFAALTSFVDPSGLAFGGKREQLYVPFAALTSFVDPSVDFGLQFAKTETGPESGETPAHESGEAPPPAERGEVPPTAEAGEEPDAGKGEGGEKVISLDQFRKK
jgi:hypothetical protein